MAAKVDDRKQQVVPEYLLKHFVALEDGRELTPLETLLLFQATRRTVMEEIAILQGMTEAQAKGTETQLKVFREVREEGLDMARQAAQEAAGQVASYLGQRRSKLEAQKPDAGALGPEPGDFYAEHGQPAHAGRPRAREAASPAHRVDGEGGKE